MIRRLGGFSVLVGFALVALPSSATDYYVNASTGNDRNAGTQASPWLSLSKVSGTSFSAGDRVYFAGGQTFSGTLTPRTAGASNTPILFGSYGTGRATINAGNGTGISITKAYITVDGLNVVGSGRTTGNTGNGIYVNADNVVVRNADVSGFQHNGVYLYGANNSRVEYVDAHDNGHTGIMSMGSGTWNNPAQYNTNQYYGHCKVYNNPGDPTVTNNWTGSGIVLGQVNGATIEYFEAYNNGWDQHNSAGNGPCGIWCWQCDYVTIQHCISHDNKTQAGKGDGDGFDFDGGTRYSTMQYCLSYNNVGPGYLLCQFSGASAWDGNTVRYCISVNDGSQNSQAALLFWNGGGTFQNARVYNNVFYGNLGYAVNIYNSCSGSVFYNNIFMPKTATFTPNSGSGMTYQGNCYWKIAGGFSCDGYTDLIAWATAKGQEKISGTLVGLSANPQLANPGAAITLTDPTKLATLTDYQLLPGSPCINTGLALQSLFGINPGPRDYYGNSIPQGSAFDIGVHEAAPSTLPFISSLTPAGGTTAGGTAVTISGGNLTGTTSVTFGGTGATSLVVVNASQVTCVAPAHAAGVVDVSLSAAAGSCTRTGGYTYTYPNGPGGGITREWWTGISGTAVADLTGNAAYPNSPTGTQVITGLFEGPTSWADNYGTRMHGYFIPPSTGPYTFYIASDDASELWLSTGTDPAAAVKIAYVSGWTNARDWTANASQKSAAISLTAGNRYYIRALHKEGTGGDNLAVGVDLPGGVSERPIPGHRLDPWTGGNAAPTVTTPASATPSPVTGTTTALSVLGADDGGETGLTYTWATTGTPPAAVSFSANGTNAAKNVTATFTRAGSYSFQVTIKDAGNLTVTSNVSATVNQTLAAVIVSPASASVTTGGTQAFSAAGTDQFGSAMSATPTWSVSGGGSINSSTGVFTAGSTAGGPYTVTATSGTQKGTASVTVVAAAPTLTGVSPNSGTTVGGTPVTIAGTNLTGTTSVTFGGTAATSLVVVSATSVTCVTPAHAAGAVDVALSAPGGTATGAGAFTYVAGGTSYFVDAVNGRDTNAGTQASPWQTLSKVNGRNFAAGDHIYFAGGQSFTGQIYFDVNDTGTAANPIVVSSYGTGRATISAGAAGNSGIFAYNTAGLTIMNLIVVGVGQATATKAGISFWTDLAGNVKLQHAYIDNCDVSGFKDGITLMGGSGTSGFNDVRVTNSAVHDNRSGGLSTWSSSLYGLTNVYVGHCQFYGNPGDPASSSPEGSGVVLGRVDGGVVERCVAYGNGATGGGGVGIWCYDSNNVSLQYCESYDNRTSKTNDGGGFDLDGSCTNCVMQYNYSHGNDGAGYGLYEYNVSGSGMPLWSNNVVRYNISENDGRKNSYAAIALWNNGNGMNGCEIYNNTIYLTPASSGTPRAISSATATTNFHFRNNLIVTTGGLSLIDMSSGQIGMLFQGNDYWPSGGSFVIKWSGTPYSSLSAWRTATSQEKNGTTAVGFSVDPLLTSPGAGVTIGNADQLATLSGYRLQSASPMIDAGLNLQSFFGVNPGSRDYYGNSLPQGSAFDIGAHECPPSLPAAPSGLTAVAVSSSQINLAWTDNATNETGFKIERKTGAGGTYSQIATVGANVTTYSDTGLAAATTYYYRVRANNASGDSSYSNEASATTPDVPPVAPSTLTAVAVHESRVDLAWTDASINETGFEIERAIGGGAFAALATVGAGVTAYVNEFLDDATLYTYRVRAVNASGSSAWSNSSGATTLAAGALPSPWETADIGSCGVAGNASWRTNVFTGWGSGADIWGTADAFRYVYRPLTGDGEIRARVLGVENTNGWAKAGVMVRQTLEAGSAHAYMALTPGNGLAYQRRTAAGGTSVTTSGGAATAPRWVRIVRAGSTLTGATSTDGTAWTTVGTETIAMGDPVYVGLAVTSHDNTQRCTVRFDSVELIRTPVDATVSLAAGYTLIALPLEPGSPFTAESLAQHVAAHSTPSVLVTGVIEYPNSFTGEANFNTHPVGSSVNNFAIVPGRGYFLRCSGAGTWTLTGYRLGMPAVALQAGYNLVGLPKQATGYTSESASAEVNSQPGGSVTQVVRYDVLQAQFRTHPTGTSVENFPLEMGAGYFFRCVTGSTWTLLGK